MTTVTRIEVEALVAQLPTKKLPTAYKLLLRLAKSTDKPLRSVELMRLPVAERRRLMKQQALQMTSQVTSQDEEESAERNEWQAGDFSDN